MLNRDSPTTFLGLLRGSFIFPLDMVTLVRLDVLLSLCDSRYCLLLSLLKFLLLLNLLVLCLVCLLDLLTLHFKDSMLLFHLQAIGLNLLLLLGKLTVLLELLPSHTRHAMSTANSESISTPGGCTSLPQQYARLK